MFFYQDSRFNATKMFKKNQLQIFHNPAGEHVSGPEGDSWHLLLPDVFEAPCDLLDVSRGYKVWACMTARILWHESVSCSKAQDAMPLVRELLHSKLQTEM